MSIDPEVCGLNSNALFGYHNKIAELLREDMIKLYPSINTVHYKIDNWDKVVKKTTEDILKSLPDSFNIKKVKTFYGDKCSNPSIIVLLHELERFNMLIEVMRDTLSQLTKVLKMNVSLNFFTF